MTRLPTRSGQSGIAGSLNLGVNMAEIKIHRKTLREKAVKGGDIGLIAQANIIRRKTRDYLGRVTKRGKISYSGGPPRPRRRGALKDIRRGKVKDMHYVVGPIYYMTQENKTVPQVHEFGGRHIVRRKVGQMKGRKLSSRQKRRFKQKFKGQRLKRKTGRFVSLTVNYMERTYMSVGLSRARSELLKAMKDTIRP